MALLSSCIMRGNWLYYRGRWNAFPFRVEQVTKKKVGYHAEPGENRMLYLRLCECQAIPLDARQLEKNGWKAGSSTARMRSSPPAHGRGAA